MPRLRSGRNVELPFAWTKRYTVPRKIALRLWRRYTSSALVSETALLFAGRLRQMRAENYGRSLISAATAAVLLRDLDNRGGAGAYRLTFEAALITVVYDTWNCIKAGLDPDLAGYLGDTGVGRYETAAAYAKKREDAAGSILAYVKLD